MNFLKSILLIIVSGALFVIAVFVVFVGLLAIDPQFTARVIHTVSAVGYPFVPIGIGLAVGGVALYLLSRVGRDSDSSGTFTFDGAKGPVDVSLRAIEDYVAKHFSEKPVVHAVRAKVGVSRDRKKIRVRATISVWSEQSIKGAGETVQREIIHCLKEGLGLDDVEFVRVSVDKIIAGKSAKAVAHKPAFPKAEPAKAPTGEAPAEDGG